MSDLVYDQAMQEVEQLLARLAAMREVVEAAKSCEPILAGMAHRLSPQAKAAWMRLWESLAAVEQGGAEAKGGTGKEE